MDKLIIFDLDGTLLYTLRDITESVNYAMEKLGLPKYGCEQVREMVGNGFAVLMGRAVTAEHIELKEKALEYQRSYYAAHADEYTVPYEGVINMLEQLKKEGFYVAVHTNKDENCAVELIRRHFGDLVDFVRGTTSEILKPNPSKIITLMQELDIPRERAVYCGDSDVDVKTAANAGLQCISVTWGFKSKEFLIEHGAKNFADSPLDAVKSANKLIKQG